MARSDRDLVRLAQFAGVGTAVHDQFQRYPDRRAALEQGRNAKLDCRLLRLRPRLVDREQLGLVSGLGSVVNAAQQLQVLRVVDRRWCPAGRCEQGAPPDVVELETGRLAAPSDCAPLAVPFDDEVAELLPLG
ncbi:hypothetical protein [Dermatobacter hominis]|uniref:hypothetical protein n=1 Tax=Dermatobacter hominis TaxID=2884263 RepID=UPI001D10DC7D|nr:hypothetical protein [Dermatobacter hominis]UDY36282.1 hypothetical protein LH044_01815 [Dermatobacter hominis]